MQELANVNVMMMIKDGGYSNGKITPGMLGQLAKAINDKGSETVHMLSGSIEVVGILVTGNQTGDRVIVLGPKAIETTESA